MYDQVLSKPDGGDLQDRVENYFLAWSNSVRMDLEALGVLDSHGSTDALFSIDPVAMTDEQLDAAMALMERKAVLGERRGGAAGRDRDYPDGGAGLGLQRYAVTQFKTEPFDLTIAHHAGLRRRLQGDLRLHRASVTARIPHRQDHPSPQWCSRH